MTRLNRRYVAVSDEFMNAPLRFSEKLNEEEYCNLCITLINQTTYLIKKLIDRQQQQFLEQGGIKEQMYRARIAYRSQTGQTRPTSQDNKT